jgi:hypothetical protein
MGKEESKMTDRELLELAAKAAQMPITWIAWPSGKTDACIINGQTSEQYGDGYSVWNPLTDDGDALRLAVKLHINVRFCWDGCDDQFDPVIAERGRMSAHEQIGMFRLELIDENAATRRAIVRAAAEIGRAM